MNNGENQTNTTTNNGVNSAPIANEKTTAGIQAMHPQALAASGAQKEQVLATIQAAGVEQAPVVEEKKAVPASKTKKSEENKDKKHYCTLDNYHWICNECYNDFEKLFKFNIKELNEKYDI